MNATELKKIEHYLQTKFDNDRISVIARTIKEDSADLLLDQEHIGVIFKDDEDGETCYHVQMTMLEMDLQDGAAETD